jgi:hypothetical protein
MKFRPCALAAAYNSRATLAEAVVWSTKTAPFFMPAKAPSAPMDHCAQIVVVAHAAKNDVGMLDGFTRCGGVRWLLGIGQILGTKQLIWRRCGCTP